MARRRLRPACVFAIAVAVIALASLALALRAVGVQAEHAADGGMADVDAARSALAAEVPQVPSVLPARRMSAPGMPLPLLLALATVSAAGRAAWGAATRTPSVADQPRAPSLLPVPCGTRAPPAIRFA